MRLSSDKREIKHRSSDGSDAKLEMGIKDMNVYDFDGTIFYSDCSIGFAIWCMKRKPKLWFTWFPRIIKTLILYKQGRVQNYRLQREMFSYLTLIDDFDKQIEKYWDKYEGKISAWYLAQKREDDLIISASPSCIIEPIANRLGVLPQNLYSAFNADDVKSGLLEKLSDVLGIPISYFYGDSYNVTGNNNATGNNNTVNASDDRLLQLLLNKDEQLTMAMKQTSKAQDQMDRLLDKYGI